MAYIEWHGSNLLVADRMPVQVCDVCSERTYDDDAVEILLRLLWSTPPMSRPVMTGRNT